MSDEPDFMKKGVIDTILLWLVVIVRLGSIATLAVVFGFFFYGFIIGIVMLGGAALVGEENYVEFGQVWGMGGGAIAALVVFVRFCVSVKETVKRERHTRELKRRQWERDAELEEQER